MIEGATIKVCMDKIQRYNCEGLCQEMYCSKKYSHFTNTTINGLKVHLAFCVEHSKQFEENGWVVSE